MSADRSLTLRILSNKPFLSDLLVEFVANYWTNKNHPGVSSLAKEDTEDYNFIDYRDWESLKPVLDYRENKGYHNVLTFIVDQLDEAMMITSKKLDMPHKEHHIYYELSFNPGIGKRLEEDDRSTDYEFYIARIIPHLESLGCEIAAIKCED